MYVCVQPTYSCEWEGCPRNQKPFTKRHKMYNHLRTHTGERPFVCTKSGCEKRFSRPDSLTTHIKTHSNVRPFICAAKGCGKAYYHARSLKKHEKTHDLSTATTPNEPVSVPAAFPNYSIAGPMPVDYNQVPLHPPPPHPHQHSHPTSPHPTTFVSNQFHVPMPAPSTTLPYTPSTIEQPQGGQLHPNDSNNTGAF
ncbi:hypothetical protein BJV82DRAFT_607679 [Fennellomyces sp. T-0311]|nr:hypothetical protein BJV82DRAFT_607679 [Fennellomyces sp. T-0311]